MKKKLIQVLQKAFLSIINSPNIEKWIYLLHNSKRKLIGGSIIVDVIAFTSAILIQNSLPNSFPHTLFYIIAYMILILLSIYIFLLNLFNVKRSYLILIRKYLRERVLEFNKEIIQRSLTNLSYVGEIDDLEKIKRKIDLQLYDRNIRIKDINEVINHAREEQVLQILNEDSSENFKKPLKLRDGFEANDGSVWSRNNIISIGDIIEKLETGEKFLIEGEMGIGKSVLCQSIVNRIIEKNLFKIRISESLPILINLNKHFAYTEEEMLKNILPIKMEKLRQAFAEKIVCYNNTYIFDGFNEYYNREKLSSNTAHPFYLFQDSIKNGVIVTGRGYPLKEFRDVIKGKREKTDVSSKYTYLLLSAFSDKEVREYIETIVSTRFSEKHSLVECTQKTNLFLEKLRKTFPISYNIPIITFVLTRDIEEFIEGSNVNFPKKYYEILFSCILRFLVIIKFFSCNMSFMIFS
ncbi:hypothetical protein ES705_17730 [subsurface metagenome]